MDEEGGGAGEVGERVVKSGWMFCSGIGFSICDAYQLEGGGIG